MFAATNTHGSDGQLVLAAACHGAGVDGAANALSDRHQSKRAAAQHSKASLASSVPMKREPSVSRFKVSQVDSPALDLPDQVTFSLHIQPTQTALVVLVFGGAKSHINWYMLSVQVTAF